ncbi:MAG: spore maturation protein A [Clostridiales bacterium]|mgnify:CR=1 FL=1|jgi:spore maturation protein A|nr:spore maturation protein A [Clostridiales bacterium]
MAMAWIWTVMVMVSLVFGILSGNIDAVSSAALEGATEAVKLCLGIGGAICLWSGIMEVMRSSGILAGLTKLLRRPLVMLFPSAAKNNEALDALSLNVSANFLGLGNAATPAGIRAATLLKGRGDVAGDDLCTLVVLNTSSIQLIPATICAVRGAAGAASAFDILPAVWITSVISVTAGLMSARFLRRIWKG